MPREKSYYTALVAGLFMLATVMMDLYIYFNFKAKIIDILFLDIVYFAIPAILFLVVFTVQGKNYIGEILGEPKDSADAIKDIGIGYIIGILLAIFFLADFAWKSISGSWYLPMATAKEQVTFVTTALEPVPDLFVVYIFDHKIGLGEEFFMSFWRLTLLGFFAKNLKPVQIFNHPDVMLKVFGLCGVIFGILHIFAYRLEKAAMVSAFLGNQVFNVLFFKWGFLAAFTAHGMYDFVFDMILRTGLQVFLTKILVFFIVIGSIYGLIQLRKA